MARSISNLGERTRNHSWQVFPINVDTATKALLYKILELHTSGLVSLLDSSTPTLLVKLSETDQMYGKYHDGKSCWKHGAWRFISGTVLVITGISALIVLSDLQQKLHVVEAQALQATKDHDKLATELQIEIEEKKKIAETWQKQKREWDNERQLLTDEFEQKARESDQKIQDAKAQAEAAKEEMAKLRLELTSLRDRLASVTVSSISAADVNGTSFVNQTTVGS